jgi:hypothetical protein
MWSAQALLALPKQSFGTPETVGIKDEQFFQS